MHLFWSLFLELSIPICLEAGLQAGTYIKKKDNDLDFLQFAVETSYTKMRTSCFESQ